MQVVPVVRLVDEGRHLLLHRRHEHRVVVSQAVDRHARREVEQPLAFQRRRETLLQPRRATAKRFYQSPEYQEILKIRLSASSGWLFLVDGVDGPNPPPG